MSATPLARPGQVIESTLEAFVCRRRRVRAAGVLCLALAAALAWLITGAIIDRVAQLDVWARCMVLTGFVLLLGLAVGRGLVLVLSRRFNRLIAARQLEALEPSLRDALVSVVSQETLPPAQRASAAMVEQVSVGVADHLLRSRPQRRMTLRHVRPAIGVLLGVMMVVLVLACIPWLGLPQLVMRQLLPLSDIPPVTTTQIDVSTGSIDLPQGQSLSIVADVTGNEGPVTLMVGEDAAQLQPIVASRVFGDRYTVTLPAVERDLVYRIEAGDARSINYRVRVLRRPGVAGLKLELAFPPYIGTPPLRYQLEDGRIEAVRGTKARLTITSTEPLRQATLDLPSGTITAAETIDPYVRTADFTIEKSGPWAAQLISDRGVLGGSDDKKQQIVAVDDHAPIAQFLKLDLRMHPSDVLAVPFQVIDDFGIDSLRLDVSAAGKPLLSRAMPIAGRKRMIRDVVTVDLAPFALAYGDVVTMKITAVDGARQERSTSPPCRVLLSPRSVDPRLLRHIEALRDAAELAESVAERPADAALGLRAMLRAIATSESTTTSDVIEASLDDMQQVASRLAREDGPAASDTGLARQSAQRLKALLRSRESDVAAAEMENIQSGETALRELSPPVREAARQSLQRARKDLADRLKSLGVPDDATALGRLKQIAAQGQTSQRVPISGLARAWEPAKADQTEALRDRVAIAAQAEVLRADSDLAWARDLQLIARAMTAQPQKVDAATAARTLSDATETLEKLHRANRSAEEGRQALAAAAEGAREALRRLAGDADTPAASTGGAFEQALEKSARLQQEHLEAPPEAGSPGTSDAPETWQPPARDAPADAQAAETRARELSRIARAQHDLANRTDTAAAEAAPALAGAQEGIAADLSAAEQADAEEGFFERNQTPQREQALLAMRDAQRKLSELPQELMQLRQRAEQVERLNQTAQAAQREAAGAAPDQGAAAQRNAAMAARQLDAARQELSTAAAALAQSSGQAMASASREMGAMGRPIQAAAETSLVPSLQAVQAGIAAGEPATAEREQANVLNAIADLQATLRAAQRRLVHRDPLVAARFYAQRAGEALKQQPPNFAEARVLQRQTSAALEQAWDQAMGRALKDRLTQLPAFRSLLMDDYPLEGTGIGDAELRSAIDRSTLPQWGRLREQTNVRATGANNVFVPPGYEEALRAYFQALDKATSAPRPREEQR